MRYDGRGADSLRYVPYHGDTGGAGFLGSNVVAKLRERGAKEITVVRSKDYDLRHEGNVRRITIKNEQGQTLIEIPLTIGVVGAILLPVWAAIGAIAALAAKFTIVVEKVDSETPPDK